MRDKVVRQRIDDCDADGGVGDMLHDYHEAHFGEGPQEEEEPEASAKAYFEMLEATQKPLHSHTKVSRLDAIGRLMALKSQFSLSRDAFDSLLTVFGSILPENHITPKSMKEHEKDAYCPKYKASRFLEVDSGDGQPKKQLTIPVKILRYLPFIPRIQRLFMTEEFAQQMTWHKKGVRYNPDKMVHPSDGESWKNFDRIHRDKANEARNLVYSREVSMSNMQGSSVVHLVEEGGQDVKSFMKGVKVTEIAPPIMMGAAIHAQIDALRVNDDGGFVGYGEEHAWTQKSVLWRLPYIDDFLLPHNIDVMHTEKNWGEALFGTVMDISDKTKDNVKARVDLAMLCDRPRYEMRTPGPGRKWKKTQADFVLMMAQKKEALEWIQKLQFPYGYAANLRRGVNLTTM
ncbi:uncharacterized protein LOC120669355 [Panicum virgatum]|uniref:uncharacterized protein LOC120669355 n=1 Tax=Panicum virgatum TaxID=38727 RepID=UPI0019D55C84|nr:uncharacterized protein LOC120669355 [Panicum virgatum]